MLAQSISYQVCVLAGCKRRIRIVKSDNMLQVSLVTKTVNMSLQTLCANRRAYEENPACFDCQWPG